MPPIWNISHCTTSERPLASLRHQPAGLLGEVHEDRAGLEHREVAVVLVDDGRDASVGIELQVPGLFLLEILQGDGAHGVGQLELLERDRGLPAIRSGRRIEFDHLASSPLADSR